MSERTEPHFRDYYIGGRSEYDPDYTDDTEAMRTWGAYIARVRRDAQREAAQMIRDACDRWEVDGDDERLVNDVLDPWTSRVLSPEESP